MAGDDVIRRGATRRMVLTGALALGATAGFGAWASAQASSPAPQQIADHFSGVRTMMGEFVQFGPRGEQTGGKFFIERPGKLRFNYDKPSPVRVIADGKSVLVSNSKLKSHKIYPLSKTPLKLLLDKRIDLSGKTVKDVRREADLTTIVLGDRKVFGDSTIKLMFDPASYELRQWTITDAQGKDTTVMIFNVQQDVTFDKKVFHIDYRGIRNARNERGG